jgi:hypothetical protein
MVSVDTVWGKKYSIPTTGAASYKNFLVTETVRVATTKEF